MPRRDRMPAPVRVEWQRVVDGACVRKKPFGVAAAHRRVVAEQHGDPRLRAYRCPFCGAWHLGHVPSMKQVRKLAAAIRARAASTVT